ncbi:MAG: winged helix DNA-binding protein, partial [Alicyclobacillus sp.]|nr:winged helix DNA-binding protein [Alicyclobacillus sp.]
MKHRNRSARNSHDSADQEVSSSCFSPTQEDYLEAIWELTRKQGYVRVTDVAQVLGIQSSAVSKMVRKLDEDGVLEYRRYRGFRMTTEGYKRGQEMHKCVFRGSWTPIPESRGQLFRNVLDSTS